MREKFKKQLGIGGAEDDEEVEKEEDEKEDGNENFNDVLENEYADD